MRLKIINRIVLLSAICVSMVFFMFGCGGGGGGSDGTVLGTGGSSSPGTGTVALLLADGPADDFDNIWLLVTEVSLIPEGDGDPVVIFQSSSGIEFDLLDLRDEKFLLKVKKDVPAGVYEKIRLRVADITAAGDPDKVPCTDIEIKLPSGKIDLEPSSPFEVVPNRTLSVTLDIRAHESIKLKEAGKSGKCIFRPVVFVEIEEGAPIRPCPRILSGTILSLVKREGITVGFVLDLDKRRGDLDVRVTDRTAIFDEDGEFGSRDLLEEGQQVKVRGKLDDNGRLLASVVVIGQVLMVKGEVDGPVDGATGLFPFTPFPGEELIGQRDVAVAEETFILIGCDTEVGEEAIQAGMTARVVGKEDADGVLRSVLILLQPREVSGEIILIKDGFRGKTVTVEKETGVEVEVFIPTGTPINIEGDGPVPPEFFCEGRQVRIILDRHIRDPLTATLVLVQAERRVGTVAADPDPDDPDRILIVDGESVSVQLGATILDTRGAEDTLVGFEVIRSGDELEYFGLDSCPGDTGFTAFVILITG